MIHQRRVTLITLTVAVAVAALQQASPAAAAHAVPHRP